MPQVERLRLSSSPSRILVVENDLLNAQLVAETLRVAGHSAIGPAASVSHAIDLIAHADIQAAVVDLQLIGEQSWWLVAKIEELKVPWIMTTTAPIELVRCRYPNIPCLRKPYSIKIMMENLERMLVQKTIVFPEKRYFWMKNGNTSANYDIV